MRSISVVKIGSSSLLRHGVIRQLVDSVYRLSKNNRVVLVSSGAVAFGCKRLNVAKPATTSEKQAMASVGQTQLMNHYERLFSVYKQPVAQILLTKDCILSVDRSKRIVNTFNTLFRFNIIPIVNENDTVSTEELKFGDNDMLASMTACILGARDLTLITDVEGILDEHHRLIPKVHNIHSFSIPTLSDTNGWGSGGIHTKLSASRLATKHGINTYICSYNQLDKIGSCAMSDVPCTRIVGESKPN